MGKCLSVRFAAITFFFFNCQSKSWFLTRGKLQMWDLQGKKQTFSPFHLWVKQVLSPKHPVVSTSTTHLWDFNRRVAVDEAAAEIHLWAGKPGLPVVHLHSLPIYSWARDTSEFKQRGAGGGRGGSAQWHKTAVELIKCAELSKVIDFSGVRGELGSKLWD